MSLLFFGGERVVADSSPTPTDPAEIAVTISPTNRSVSPGATVVYTVTVTRTNYTGAVSFSVSGLPAGVTGAFSPTTVSGADAVSTLTLTAAGGAADVSNDAFTVTATGSGVTDATVDGAVSVVTLGDWQLPAGNFESAVMPMTAVYPRPDGETSSNARHRKAYPGIANRVPIAIQGGAYPFLFEIIAGPAGASIGGQIGTTDYGVWSWTPSADAAAQTVTVRVTDQDLSTVDVTWTVTADTASFVFLDPAVGSSGSGTAASPFKTWTDAFGTVSTTANNSGKILVLRGGTHAMVGFTATGNNLALVGNNKPMAWMNYPGESPVVDCSSAIVNFISGSDGDDFYVQGVGFANSRATVANSRFFFFAANAGERTTWFEVEFANLGRGTAGNDNPGGIVMFNGTGNSRNYVTVKDCSIDNYSAAMVGSMYDTRYVLIEGCTLGTQTGASNEGIFIKGRNRDVTIRRCTSIISDFNDGGAVCHNFGAGEVAPSSAQYVEVCYCLLRCPTATRMPLQYHWSTALGAVGSRFWSYRNTLIGRGRLLDNAASEYLVDVKKNILITNDSPLVFGDDQGLVTYADNLNASYANIGTLLDTGTYLMTGSTRTTYLGTRGHEISAGA